MRVLRGHALAEDPGPGRHQTQHQDHRPSLEEGGGGRSPVAARLPYRASPRRDNKSRAAAAADRPMGRPTSAAATALAALAVLPSRGPPRRGPRRAPRPPRRPRPGTGGSQASDAAGHHPRPRERLILAAGDESWLLLAEFVLQALRGGLHLPSHRGGVQRPAQRQDLVEQVGGTARRRPTRRNGPASRTTPAWFAPAGPRPTG